MSVLHYFKSKYLTQFVTILHPCSDGDGDGDGIDGGGCWACGGEANLLLFSRH